MQNFRFGRNSTRVILGTRTSNVTLHAPCHDLCSKNWHIRGGNKQHHDERASNRHCGRSWIFRFVWSDFFEATRRIQHGGGLSAGTNEVHLMPLRFIVEGSRILCPQAFRLAQLVDCPDRKTCADGKTCTCAAHASSLAYVFDWL